MAKYKRKEPTPVTFPFFDGPVFIRILDSQEKWDVEARAPRDPDTGRFVNPGEVLAMMVAASVVDAAGRPIFSEEEMKRIGENDLAVMWEAVADIRDGGDGSKKKWQVVASQTTSNLPSGSP